MKRIVIIILVIAMSASAMALEAIEFGWASDLHVNSPTFGPMGAGDDCGSVPAAARRHDNGVISFSPCIGKFANILTYFTDEGSDFLVLTGDNIYSGVSEAVTEEQWTRVLTCADEYAIPVYFAFGNHCVAPESTLANILAHIGQRTRTEIDVVYYSFDAKGYHFIVLDLNYTDGTTYFTASNDRAYLPNAEANWLIADLAANKDKPTFVFTHQAAKGYTAGISSATFPLNNIGLIAILETYGNVQAYFNGHTHGSGYELLNGIRYYQTDAIEDGCKFVPLVNLDDDSSLTITDEAGTIVSIKWEATDYDTGHAMSSGDTFTLHDPDNGSSLAGDYTAHANTTASELHFDAGGDFSGTPFDNDDYVENTSATANDYEAYTKINIDADGNVTLTDVKDADDQGAWTDTTWQIDMGKVKVTVDNTKVSGNDPLYNFPVLITEDNMPDSFWENVSDQSDGTDIFVTSITGDAEWPRELIVDTFDPSGKVMELWVKIPALQYDTDTEFLIHYGGSGAYSNSTDVWDEDYVVVYHFNDDPDGDAASSLADSTVNVVHGDPTGGMTTADLVAGAVGNGWDFDGSNDRVALGGFTELTDILDGEAGFTIEYWVDYDVLTGGVMNFWVPITNAGTTGMQANTSTSQIKVGGRGNAADDFDSDLGDTTLIVDTMYFFGGTLNYATDRMFLFLDGAVDNGTGGIADWVPTVYTIGNAPDRSAYIADNAAAAFPFNGIMDEFRMSKIVRTDDWIATCFNNQDSPSTFYDAEVYVPVDTTGVPATGQLNGVMQ